MGLFLSRKRDALTAELSKHHSVSNTIATAWRTGKRCRELSRQGPYRNSILCLETVKRKETWNGLFSLETGVANGLDPLLQVCKNEIVAGQDIFAISGRRRNVSHRTDFLPLPLFSCNDVRVFLVTRKKKWGNRTSVGGHDAKETAMTLVNSPASRLKTTPPSNGLQAFSALFLLPLYASV